MILLILVFLMILMLNLRLKLLTLGLSELPFKLTFPIVHVSCLDKKISDLIIFESRIYNYSIHSVYASIIKTRNLGLYKFKFKSFMIKTFNTQSMQGNN